MIISSIDLVPDGPPEVVLVVGVYVLVAGDVGHGLGAVVPAGVAQCSTVS